MIRFHMLAHVNIKIEAIYMDISSSANHKKTQKACKQLPGLKLMCFCLHLYVLNLPSEKLTLAVKFD